MHQPQKHTHKHCLLHCTQVQQSSKPRPASGCPQQKLCERTYESLVRVRPIEVCRVVCLPEGAPSVRPPHTTLHEHLDHFKACFGSI